jgi:hypothetical protein
MQFHSYVLKLLNVEYFQRAGSLYFRLCGVHLSCGNKEGNRKQRNTEIISILDT